MHFLGSIITLLAACASLADADNCAAANRVGITAYRAARAKQAFKSVGLAPGKVKSTTINPTIEVIPSYNGKVVNFGTKFTTPETVAAPLIRFDAEEGHDPTTTNYTIFMLDPDVPNPTTELPGFFLHLGQYDAHPTCVKHQTQRKTYRPYESLTPGSIQAHRYTFLVYRQPAGTFTPPFEVQEAGGASFNLHKFVNEGKLVGPLGGNYLLEGGDTNVPTGGSKL